MVSLESIGFWDALISFRSFEAEGDFTVKWISNYLFIIYKAKLKSFKTVIIFNIEVKYRYRYVLRMHSFHVTLKDRRGSKFTPSKK